MPPKTIEQFVEEIKVLHRNWQKMHIFNEGMSGGYGNPLLACDLMKRIETYAKNGTFKGVL